MKTLNTGNKIHELVRKAETDYISGTTHISEFVDVSLYDDINKIEAYLHSKFESGDKDSLERDKPFFNIVLAARNIWFRATDIDRKNIRIKATKVKDTIKAFLATVHLQHYLRKSNFGQFLNDWGLTLASYGSAVVKFVEKGGELEKMVVPWSRIIVDAIDFDANPVIEIMELSPFQLRQREGYDKEQVDELINSVSHRETISKQNKDNKDDYIRIYEVHGNLPLSYLTDKKEDEDEYTQQVHIISFVESKKGKFDDFTLYKGRERRSPYMITHLLKEDGYTLGLGAVKNLFEAQWMVNHSIKSVKDQLDLASKLIFQTADPNFANQNVLSAIETGDILIHKENMPITHIANNANDIASLLNFKSQWQLLAQEISSTPDIMRGNNMPSGTAYRQAAIIQQESASNFEMMTENKGLYLENMIREFVIPYIKKKMDTTEEIVATLDTYGVDKIDEMYIKNESVRRVNSKIVDMVIAGQKPINLDRDAMLSEEQNNLKEHLSSMGDQRFYKPSEVDWKTEMKDFEWDLDVEITGENVDKQATLETLTTIFQTIANPNTQMALQTPEGKLLFNRIVEEAGKISPAQIPFSTKSIVPPMVGQAGGSPIEGLSTNTQ
jgi:hypothetical protein